MQFENDEVHIWLVEVDNLLEKFSTFHKYLSIDEKKRANRFCFEKDQKNYIISHGALRALISSYLEIHPKKLKFTHGKYGKPEVTDNLSGEKLYFNMSHSNGLALYVVARDREVGIDIEYIRDIPEMAQIVERFFSNTEKKVFYSLPESWKKQFFFQIWVRKESILKGIGAGLHQPLEKFDVLLETDEIPEPIADNLKKIPQWHIEDLNPSTAYAAAYAIKGLSRLRWYRYRNTETDNKRDHAEGH